MNQEYKINWIRIGRMLSLWAAFYLFVKFGLFWFPEGGYGFKSYIVNRKIFIHLLTILLVAKSINTLISVFIWDYLVARSLKGLVPQLLIQSTSMCIYFVAALIITSQIFGESIAIFLTTIGGLGIIIGFGIQRLVLDIFCGLAINTDRAFTLGDFIQVYVPPTVFIGRVTKISWRLTTLITSEGSQISIPNNVMGGAVITNLSKPEPASEFEEIFYFSHDSHDDFLEEILMNAVLSVAETGCIEKNPSPRVLLAELKQNGELGIKIVYFADPVKNNLSLVKHLLHTAILRHINPSGLHFSHSINNQNRDENYLCSELLKRIPIFSVLSPDEIKALASNVIKYSFKPQTAIVSQGEKGTSMYIIKQGFVTIHVKNEMNENSVASILNPGDFFGEMSLLTGEKRTATVMSECEVVVYEITKETMFSLLNDNPDLYEEFAKAVANKIISTQEHFRNLSNKNKEKKSLIDDCLSKIKTFFIK